MGSRRHGSKPLTRALRCLKVVRRASKKQKKTALLMPLLSARGPTPLPRRKPRSQSFLVRRAHDLSPAITATSWSETINRCCQACMLAWQQWQAAPTAQGDSQHPHRKKWLGPPWAMTARAAEPMVGRLAAAHIMLVLITSSGVVAAAANAPAVAPIAKSSCTCVAPGIVR